MMNPINIVLCLSELSDVNLSLKITEFSQSERAIAQRIAEIINSIVNCNQFVYEDEITLDLVNDLDDYYSDDDIIHNNSDGSDADDESDNKENTKEHYQLNNYSAEFMEEAIDFVDAKDSSGKRRRSWKIVKNRYRSISDQNYISRFRKYLAQRGTKRKKTQNVDKIVYNKFLNAHEQYLPIDDIDIQRWALQAAKEVHLDDFQASECWLLNFKNRHGICSRKITNILTKKEVTNFDNIKKSEVEFIEKFDRLSKKYLPNEILNTD